LKVGQLSVTLKHYDLINMNIVSYFPKGILKDLVDSILFLSGPGAATGIAFQRMHQVIIINMGGNYTVSDIYAKDPVIKECTDTIWINGKQEIPFMLDNRGEAAMYAIGIKLGMLPFFADLPAIETNDITVGAEHWTSKAIFHLREQLMDCAEVRDGFLLIEAYLTRLLMKRDLAAVEKIRWLDKAIRNVTVEEICRSLGVTRKRLRSDAQYYFGGSVKNIQGIIRFNRTLADIAKNAHHTLSSVHEYYDQSHFINDFKARCGITPLQFKKLCLMHPAIKVTPNFISMQRETFLQFISP